MNGAPLPVREYASADEMRRHAAELRARMFAPRPVLPAIPVEPIEQTAPDAAASEPVDEFVVRTRAEFGPALRATSREQREGRAEMRGADVLKLASDVTGVTLDALRSERRISHLVKARQIAIWLLVAKAGKSLPEAGRLLGGRDHTTALHARRRVKAAMRALWVDEDEDASEIASVLWAGEWPKSDRRRERAKERRR
jgi:Bacterial dnaA protein helix-turn-helix